MKKATRQQTKEHNTTLVLKTIYGRDYVSRAEIARLTGLTRTTVSDIVSSLLEDGLVIEDGYGESLGGKPPIQVRLVNDARQLICLDLSDDDFCGAVVNLRGEFVYRQVLPLQHRRGEAALQVVYQLVEALLAQTTAPLLGIGIGTPGLVDARQGVVRQAVNRGWSDLPLKNLLYQRHQLPVFVGNDSHVAALAEYSFGESYQLPNLVLIKVGEGIGSGIVLGGHGLFTWGNTQRECYHSSLSIIDQLGEFVMEHVARRGEKLLAARGVVDKLGAVLLICAPAIQGIWRSCRLRGSPCRRVSFRPASCGPACKRAARP